MSLEIDKVNSLTEAIFLLRSLAIPGDKRAKVDTVISFLEGTALPTDESVAQVVADLRNHAMPDDIIGRGACQAAIDMLIRFPREKSEVPLDLSDCDASIGALVSELNALRTSMEIIRNGEDDAIGEMLLRCIECLLLFSAQEHRQKMLPEKVGGVLNDLVELHSSLGGGSVIQRAIDMVVYLANRQVVSKDQSVADLVSDLIKTAKVWDDKHEAELEAVAEPWSEPPGRLLERASTALLLLSQNIPSLEKVAQDRLVMDLRECDCCKTLCNRAVQAIQGLM